MSIACLLFCSATLAALLRSCRIVCPALSSRSTPAGAVFFEAEAIWTTDSELISSHGEAPNLYPSTYLNKAHW